MKVFKRTMSLVLVICMLMGIVMTAPVSASAEETKTQPQHTANVSDSDISFQSRTSMGNLISGALQKEQEKQSEEDIVNSVTDVTVEGKTATVKFNNDKECQIVVAIFDEAGKKLLASGIKKITEKNTETAQVEIKTEEMPQYFIVRAFLLDENNKPLCKSFENSHYTKDFQEFLAKTTDDFKGEEVYNLDKSESNNFAVFDDSAIKITTGEKNKLQSYDETAKTYTFTNTDEKITSLKQGDIFYFKDGMLIGQILSELLECVIEGTLTNEREILLEKAREIAARGR